jgi:hypothetical protein
VNAPALVEHLDAPAPEDPQDGELYIPAPRTAARQEDD